MDAPIHAAENVDKGENLPRVIAAAAGVLIIAVVIGVVAFSGIWNPPPTSIKAPAQQTQSQAQ